MEFLMQLAVAVINHIELIDELLAEFYQNGITGATILESKGIARSLPSSVGEINLPSLNFLLNPDDSYSKTILMVTDDANIPVISKIINKVTGGLDKPDTGILFTIPVSYTEGL